ncbi:hypothetical protein [Winogradskyella vincentii]|uniref:Uncharacterized protein n=1 Tax=Winogradskyella vincentii TaxID=2877122 RepID=A0ABS7XVL3_9FLAO|nr:hypothetical protein [Winogradskyella vincentii]MCA0151688.1 hypothetical protein [Winogradskyella vincentii]
MTKKIGKYIIVEDLKLIIEYYSGTIKVEDLIGLKEKIKLEPNYDFYYNTILDLRNCNLVLSIDDLHKIYKYFDSNFIKREIRNVAYLADAPNEAALSILFTRIDDNIIEMDKSVFSSTEGVYDWLQNLITINETELESLLSLAKKQDFNVFE